MVWKGKRQRKRRATGIHVKRRENFTQFVRTWILLSFLKSASFCQAQNMDSLFSYGLYNCSTIILRRDITILLMLNRSELLNILQNALDSSTEREVLRDAFLDCFFNYQERPFDLSWWQKLFWSLIFAAMLLVATGGNVIVIWIVLGKWSLF